MQEERTAFDYNGNLIIKNKWGRNDRGQMHMVTGNSRVNCFYAVAIFWTHCLVRWQCLVRRTMIYM